MSETPLIVASRSLVELHMKGKAFAVEDLLAEPPARHGTWIVSAFARVLASSKQPVVIDNGSLSDGAKGRLANAGWPLVPPGELITKVSERHYPQQMRDVISGAKAIGSPRPTLVLVGEVEPQDRGLPFFSRSGVWLLHALRALGHDEMRVLLCNAYLGPAMLNRGIPTLFNALSGSGAVWIGMGERAQQALKSFGGIEHCKVPHPAWARRFKFQGGPDEFARVLEAAGVPKGSDSMFSYPVDLAPQLSEPLNLPTSVAYKTIAGRTKKGHLNGKKREIAMRAYVTGDAASYTDAAKLSGLNLEQVRAAAREEDWEGERTKFNIRVRERVYAQSADAIGKAEAQAKELAWSGAVAALTKVNQRILSGEIKVGSRDAESLVRTSLALSDRQTANAGNDPELDRLRSLSIRDLANELEAVAKSQIGVEEEVKK